jgi:hypothetical protein
MALSPNEESIYVALDAFLIQRRSTVDGRLEWEYSPSFSGHPKILGLSSDGETLYIVKAYGATRILEAIDTAVLTFSPTTSPTRQPTQTPSTLYPTLAPSPQPSAPTSGVLAMQFAEWSWLIAGVLVTL